MGPQPVETKGNLMASNVTPLVRAEASRLGVDINAVAGTGAGGRVSLRDVRAAATPYEVPRTALSVRAAVNPAGPDYARNPLTEAARAGHPTQAARAARIAPAPTLFPSGDLPAFTASGIDPRTLLQVAWQARHALAGAPTPAQAYRLLQDYTGPEGPLMAALDFEGHPGNQDYRARVDAWLAAGVTADDVLRGFDAAEQARVVNRSPSTRFGWTPGPR